MGLRPHPHAPSRIHAMFPLSPRSSRALVTALSALVLASTACDSGDSSPVGPAPLAPLAAATWLMIEAEGQPLPAVVAHRMLAGNLLEQSILESATLVVDADGSYEQHYRIRTVANGVEQSNVLVQDLGEWTAGTERYELASDTRVRSFRVEPIVNDTLRTIEAMDFRSEAGFVRGRYVPVAPAALRSRTPGARP